MFTYKLLFLSFGNFRFKYHFNKLENYSIVFDSFYFKVK